MGRTAHTQSQWPVAIYWLKHLEKLSDGDYHSAEVSNYLAFSILFAALQDAREKSADGPQVQELKQVVDRLTRLGARKELTYIGYFWLAYAQDELGLWYEATRSHLEALKRRPAFAPSRYNMAICLLKLGKSRSAYRQLHRIGPRDEQIRMVAVGVAVDSEMKGLVDGVDELETKRLLLAELDRLAKTRS